MSQNKGVQTVMAACISRESFRAPDLMVLSAWLEHAPFAFWLVDAQRPSLVVELGTHLGFSYSVFCEAIQRGRLKARCAAVDTWRGDEHAGFYGEQIFENLRRYHDPRYAAFSRLVRATFDEAVKQFEDKSIDLLHIDGRHRYDDVKHDFLTWKPKLSDNAVVLFHDISVHERDFGVFAFWQELKRDHPHFEFGHGNGLGVLGLGRTMQEGVRCLFEANEEGNEAIRWAYSRLGAAISDRWSLLVAGARIQALEGRLSAGHVSAVHPRTPRTEPTR